MAAIADCTTVHLHGACLDRDRAARLRSLGVAHASTTIGLAEVSLGLVPAGGTVSLPARTAGTALPGSPLRRASGATALAWVWWTARPSR